MAPRVRSRDEQHLRHVADWVSDMPHPSLFNKPGQPHIGRAKGVIGRAHSAYAKCMRDMWQQGARLAARRIAHADRIRLWKKECAEAKKEKRPIPPQPEPPNLTDEEALVEYFAYVACSEPSTYMSFGKSFLPQGAEIIDDETPTEPEILSIDELKRRLIEARVPLELISDALPEIDDGSAPAEAPPQATPIGGGDGHGGA